MSHITEGQRYTISVMYKQGYSQKKIAEAIEKDKSVVSRELKRNADERGRYSFRVAQELVGIRKERFRKTRRFDTSVCSKAEELLSKDYSPEQVVIRALLSYKRFVRTITTDNGSEFAQHKMIAKKLSMSVFFTHPYSSWEKGLIEYTNKLYSQYIPKKSDFNNYNSLIINEEQYSINKRPRKKLGFKSPLDLFFLSLNDPSCIY